MVSSFAKSRSLNLRRLYCSPSISRRCSFSQCLFSLEPEDAFWRQRSCLETCFWMACETELSMQWIVHPYPALWVAFLHVTWFEVWQTSVWVFDCFFAKLTGQRSLHFWRGHRPGSLILQGVCGWRLVFASRLLLNPSLDHQISQWI